VNLLNDRVLRDDKTPVELSGVVLDLLREAASLELGQQAELSQLSEMHRSPGGGRRHPARNG